MNPLGHSASKSLKFTPKYNGLRVAKRSSTTASNSETPVSDSSKSTIGSSTPSTAKPMPQLKATLATPTAKPQVTGLKRLLPPKPRSNQNLSAISKAQPAKPSLAKPDGLIRPLGLTKPSGLARPGACLSSTLGSNPRPNIDSMPKPN